MNIVQALELKFLWQGKENIIYPALIRNDNETILVDCGYAGFMPLIEEELQRKGSSFQNVTGIIITHHDIDHLGALFEIKEKYPSIKIYASAIEEKYISGKEKPPRLVQAENIFHSLPEEQKPAGSQFIEMLKTMHPVKVDYTLANDSIFEAMSEIKIISSPGHSPGHISIYDEASKTLIAADAIVYVNGEFNIANPQYTLDLKQAVASVKKLMQYKIEKVICYHGGVVENDIENKLKRLIEKYSNSN